MKSIEIPWRTDILGGIHIHLYQLFWGSPEGTNVWTYFDHLTDDQVKTAGFRKGIIYE